MMYYYSYLKIMRVIKYNESRKKTSYIFFNYIVTMHPIRFAK